MNKERLLTLARFLREKVPDKCWRFRVFMEIGTLSPQEAFERGGGCGTAGCAVGWMPLVFPDILHWELGYVVDGKKNVNLRAAADVLGLTRFAAENLFYPDCYPRGASTTRFEVADRIEAFVKEHAPATTGEGT